MIHGVSCQPEHHAGLHTPAIGPTSQPPSESPFQFGSPIPSFPGHHAQYDLCVAAILSHGDDAVARAAGRHRGRRISTTGAGARLTCPRPNLGPARPSLGPTSGPREDSNHNRPSCRVHNAPPRNFQATKTGRRGEPRPSLGLVHVRVSGLRPAVLDTPQSHNRSVVARPRPKGRVVVGLGLISGPF
jgi:hypothetical protein